MSDNNISKYTVFVKPFSLLSENGRVILRESVVDAMSHYSTKEVGMNEFELEIPKGIEASSKAWKILKEAVNDKGYLVWYCHDTNGVTISDFPEGFLDELGASLQNPHHERLQALRDGMRSIL